VLVADVFIAIGFLSEGLVIAVDVEWTLEVNSAPGVCLGVALEISFASE